MKKTFIQSGMVAFMAIGALLTGCNPGGGTATGGEEPAVAIEVVGSASMNSITVSFTPNEVASRYEYAISAADGGQKADFVSGMLASIPVDTNEAVEETFDDLDVDTYYEIYAIAYDANGTTGPVATYGFKTISDDFNVSLYYVSDNSAGFRIERSDDYVSARYALGTPDDLQAFLDGDSSLDATSGTLSDMSNDFAQNYFDLEPNTEYVFYCMGQDRFGRDTQVFQVPVTTYEEGGNNDVPNVEFSINTQDFYLQRFNVVRNDLCGKVVVGVQTVGYTDDILFGEQAAWEGKILDAVDTWSGLTTVQPMKCYTAQGSATTVDAYNTALTLDTPLDVYVMTYDALMNPYAIKKHDIVTPPFNDAVELPDESVIEIDVTDITSTQIAFTISYPDDYDANHIRAYRMDFINPDVEGYDPTNPENMSNIVNAFATGASNTMAFVYGAPTYSNTFSYSGVDGFVSGSTVYLGVLPMNENGLQDGYADAVKYVEVKLP